MASIYINAIAPYLPSKEIDNFYFESVNGLSDEWITARTGIKKRRRARDVENTNTMALEAVKNAISKLNYPLSSVDLIVSGTYTPIDTIATPGIMIQREYNLSDVVNITISAACSTFVNALEIVEGYFASGKARKALVVISDHNSGFSEDSDTISGHLWGDGAVAAFVSSERQSENDMKIIDIITKGLANVGHGPYGVYLSPRNGGLIMPHGKDVFMYACTYMVDITKEILGKNNFNLQDIDYLVPHQANIRIINNVAENLQVSEEKILVNIDKYGNTGAASAAIALAENMDSIPKNALLVLSVFGGGYSAGALLIKR